MSPHVGAMAAEEGGHSRRASGEEDCVAGPARRQVEVGRGSVGRRRGRGLTAPLMALVAAVGVACVGAVPATFVEAPLTVFNTLNVRRDTLGTPVDGRKLAVPCGLNWAGQPVCDMSVLKWGDLACPDSSICFVVAANGATGFKYTPSPNLLKKINDGVIKTSTTVLRQPASVTQVGRKELFMLQALDPTKIFPEADDLSVCFEASATGEAPVRRCVEFYFASAPQRMEVAVNQGDPNAGGYKAGVFSNAAVTIPAFSYETLQFTVRTHDWNMRDMVDIVYAENNGLVRMDQEILEGVMLTSEMPQAECVGGMRGQDCVSRTWERVFFAKPKSPNPNVEYFVEFTARSRPRGWPGYAPDTLRAGDPMARVVLKVTNLGPRFMDNLYNSGTEGTPLENSTLAMTYVNCALHPRDTLLSLAVLVAWPAVVGRFNVTFMAGRENAPPGLIVHPPGDVTVQVNPPLNVRTGGYNLVDGHGMGNFGFLGVLKEVRFAWTPRRGSEGAVYDACFLVSNATNNIGMGNLSKPVYERTRCFKLATARCHYCSAPGDTLQSIATMYGTTWQQLWTANAGSLSPYDPADRYPLDPGMLPLGTRLALGPLYYAKKLDSLDSLSTRFITPMERFKIANPDLRADGVIEVGQEMCIIPGVCVQPR